MITLNAILKALDWKSSGKWIVLSTLVGIISGIGAIVFQLLGHLIVHATLVQFAGYAPREAIGEHGLFEHHDLQFVPWMIVVVMAIGGLASGFLVYTFAPEAEGHGTDAAIDAYHNKRGVIRSRIPIVKTFASAITLGTGGSGGREGRLRRSAQVSVRTWPPRSSCRPGIDGFSWPPAWEPVSARSFAPRSPVPSSRPRSSIAIRIWKRT